MLWFILGAVCFALAVATNDTRPPRSRCDY